MNKQNEFGEYQDPLAAQNGKQAKKKVSGSTICSTVIAAIVFFMFGAVGGAICYGGYWAVLAIAKSRMPLMVRIVLGSIVGLIFLALLIAFILFAISIQSNR